MENYKKSIFSIKKRKGKYYFKGKRTPIKRSYFAYKHLRTLSNNSRRSALRFCKHARGSYPGIYGFFLYEKGKNRLNIGKCLYIGQSVNIKRRKREHEEAIKIAINELKNKDPWLYTLDSKYYKIAKNIISGKRVIFICVYQINKREWSKLNLDQARELLCLYEQWAMDTYKPKYNVIASRMTNRESFYNKRLPIKVN